MRHSYKTATIFVAATAAFIVTIAAISRSNREASKLLNRTNNTQTALTRTTLPQSGTTKSVPKGVPATAQSSQRFVANEKEGVIGLFEGKTIDNPADNQFHIVLSEALSAGNKVWLEYELEGVTDFTSVSRSINDELSQGGYFVTKSQGWCRQREQINPASLRRGDNVIRFSLPANADYGYRVRNVYLHTGSDFTNGSRQLVLNQPTTAYYYQNLGYLQGIVTGRDCEKATVRVSGDEVRQQKGSFECMVSKPGGSSQSWNAEVEAIFPDGERLKGTVAFTRPAQWDYHTGFDPATHRAEVVAGNNHPIDLRLGKARLLGNAAALKQPVALSVTALRDLDMPPLDAGMVNVTAGFNGYRFLPHGTLFSEELRVEMGYDTTLIPQGYTPTDIRTYFFDDKTGHWVALPRDTTLLASNTMVSRTTHFTDMINAIIKVPESPETSAYTPTSMKDIKVANPAANLVQIDPPGASSSGNAALQYPFKLPEGRQGMQPSLGLQYNSSGGNGWIGLGWNLETPAIEVETRWGVPRYDAAKESETYTMGGEQLTPVAYRSAWINRSAEKQFFPRVEGGFEKIIRHGNSPATYWWEVTDKSGTRYFYGGTPETGLSASAVLTDADDGNNGNIGYWALTETRDVKGNCVKYSYDLTANAGVIGGTVMGKQLYLKKITYTGFNGADGAYSVLFTRDSEWGGRNYLPRTDIVISARMGFKQVTAELLKKITVNINEQPVRSYQLDYAQGEFNKTLLQKVSEYDANGNLFNSHTFDYYNEVRDKGGNFIPLKQLENWTAGDDKVKGDFILGSIPDYNDRASAISGTKTANIGGGASVTVGIPFGKNDKSLSAGGSFDYSHSDSYGQLSLVDINGDGLADKVFRIGNVLYYRPQVSSNSGSTDFGTARPVKGVTQFLHEVSNTLTFGIEAQFVLSASASWSKTTSRTKSYFADVNGDGLLDVVINGTVWFNHINSSGDPEFTASSAPTPNPVGGGEAANAVIAQADTTGLAEAITQNPLHDVVKMWQAPYTGTVKVNAPVWLAPCTPGESDSTQVDGVRAAIQLRGTELWSDTLPATVHAVKLPANVSALAVNKGDRIYFRVQSIFNGMYDRVHWNPTISYTDRDTTLLDANGKPRFSFTAGDGFMLSTRQIISMPFNGTVKIAGSFSKPITSDSVTVTVLRNGATAIQRSYAPQQSVNEAITTDLTVNKDDSIQFKVISSSNVDFPALKWTPCVYYTQSADTAVKSVTNSDGTPLFAFNATPEYTLFARELQLQSMATAKGDSMMVAPLFNVSSLFAGRSFDWTVKQQNNLLHKEHFTVSSTGVTALPIKVAVAKGKDVYIEIYSADTTLIKGMGVSTATLSYTDSTGVVTVDSLRMGCYTLIEEPMTIFGTLWRNWGQFAYNGNSVRGAQPIDESKLNSDELQNAGQVDLSNAANADDMNSKFTSGGGYQLSKALFIPMMPDIVKNRWVGYDQSVYVTADTLSSSRMGIKDIAPASSVPSTLPAGGGMNAIDKVTKSDNISFSVGASVSSVSGSISRSTGSSRVVSDYLDMNGDRYPDYVTNGMIQYSSPTGGMSAQTTSLGKDDDHRTNSTSDGMSIGLSEAKDKSIPSNNPKTSFHVAQSGTVGGSYANSNDDAPYSLMDINGDGLPDRVYKNGDVELNLGYRFAVKENWGHQTVRTGCNQSASASLGLPAFDYKKSSYSGGVGLSLSDNKVLKTLEDINGDGLPDEIMSNDPLLVRLNTGAGFGNVIEWTGAKQISRGSSTSENANVSFSVAIKLLVIRIIINPRIELSHNFSREEVQINDVDGDGLPDYVTSDRNSCSTLTVSRSNIGRTNLLKGVQRPLGSRFELSYEQQQPTYRMPQSQWTLSGVKLYDGHTGDGVDSTLTTFAYDDGQYDRYERTSYGYGKVTSRQHDTANGNAVYRSVVNRYLNDNYYNKGLLLSEALLNAKDDTFTVKRNNYLLLDASTMSLPTVYTANSTIFPTTAETRSDFFEGQPAAVKSLHETYSYGKYGNITAYTNYGEANDAADDISSAITYHELSDKYIVGAPKTIQVTGSGTLYRKRETDINSYGEVTTIRQYNNAEVSTTTLHYDGYGNLDSIAHPANYRGQRMWYAYSYDPVVRTHVTAVRNAFGYSSTANYDYRFGTILKSTDINRQSISYGYDAAGRLTTVLSPYELAAGAPYTLQFEYHPEAVVPWALTRHYDGQHPGNPMETALFIDGLGRVLQTKKDGAIYAGKGADDTEMMIVSGSVCYDAFGRAVSTRYPVTEAKGNTGMFNSAVDDVKPTTVTYDLMDRALLTTLPDGNKTSASYGFGNDRDGKLRFATSVTDANGKTTVAFADLRGLQTAVKAPGDTWTSFIYDAMGQLLSSSDPEQKLSTHTYDMLGRAVSRVHPDAGKTTYTYDGAGNLTSELTANLRLEKSAPVRYYYSYQRVDSIAYPLYPQNNVHYSYGASGDSDGCAGRLKLLVDGAGAQQYSYGPLGEVLKTIRTVVVPDRGNFSFVTQSTYDTWNRLLQLVYPDGETVSYHYNTGGLLHDMNGLHDGNSYNYLKQLGYDKFESRLYMAYGNGTEMNYSYEPDRCRLKTLATTTSSNRLIMNNTYGYDAVNNIMSIGNAAALPKSNQLGGPASYVYKYDDLYRLSSATGNWTDGKKENTFSYAMAYTPSGNITRKTQQHLAGGVVQAKTSYDNGYAYTGTQPHAPSKIGDDGYTYDANGNPTNIDNTTNGRNRRMAWDEENRLLAIADNGNTHSYIYDAAGERVIKSKGDGQWVSVNGFNPSGAAVTGNYTLYVNPYLVVDNAKYTKHFYIEGQRIVSKLGERRIEKELAAPQAGSGTVDYSKKQKLSKAEIYAIYAALQLENPIFVAGNSGKVPYGQIKKYLNNDSTAIIVQPAPPTVTGAVKYENLQFYYHPDHIGSSNYMTDASGEVYQHDEYFPSGETFVQERNGAEHSTYLFSGKEQDEETGLYYFGARYLDPRIGIWYGVDELADKYPNVSSYAYCHNNPIKYIDPDGKFPIGMHENMVRMALSKSIISSYATECIALGTSYRSDVRGASNSRLHLDNMSGYKSISNLYNEAKQNFRAEMNKGLQVGGGNYYQAGESLHTIADFYSHSNYIDLYKNYAIENNIKLDVNTIPTFSEAMTNPQLKEYLENNGLKTGTYGEGMLAYPKDKMSEDKNSHGQMNLDSPDTPSGKRIFSGKITMHEAAKTVAQKDLENTTNNR